MTPYRRHPSFDQLETLLEDRIMILDGAMGTMIQRHGLTEQDWRGERFANHDCGTDGGLKNFSDVLCLTHPDKMTEIHRKYLEAGADIIETNSFGASVVGVEDFNFSRAMVRELNIAAVDCVRKAIDQLSGAAAKRPRFI